jgi:hypothetical protein
VAAIISYVLARTHATQIADRDIDAFFSAFREGGISSVDSYLVHYPGPRKDVEAIISRHKDAIRNYNSTAFTPNLNVFLNKTTVEVSWHLSIVFSKSSEGWRPSYFDEFKPE